MIKLGTFPTCNDDWKTLMYAICECKPLGSRAFPSIDSRLKTVRCSTEDVSDKCDTILGQTRVALNIHDSDSFAVLLYRLDELGRWLDDDILVEEAETLFQIICELFLGIEDSEPWLNDYPLLQSCPECGEPSANEGNLQVQDQVWVCLECGWLGDYQTEWPYLHVDMNCLGRLDEVVAKKLQSSNDEEE